MTLTSPIRFLSVRAVAAAWRRLRACGLARRARGFRKPSHVGIILDGNRRYARALGLASAVEGHARGADTLHRVVDWFVAEQIRHLTVWVFSLENFRRDDHEVTALLNLMEEKTRALIASDRIHRDRVRVRFAGRRQLLPAGLQDAIREAETVTRDYDGFHLNVAVAYSGCEEIVDAARAWLGDPANAHATAAQAAATLTPELLARHLYLADQPPPDLIIRTSGEKRLSGFLLWQSAYAELHFSPAYWPEFSQADFYLALADYDRRQRRFGR